MTEQYQQQAINQEPVEPTAFVSDAATVAGQLLVGVNTVDTSSTVAFTGTLPPASGHPGSTVVAALIAGAATDFTIIPTAGDAIAGTETNPIITDGGSITYVSDGVLTWFATSNNA